MLRPLWKTVCLFLTKLKILLPYDPTNHSPTYSPKGVENLCPHKNLRTDVYSSFIDNSQNVEASKRCPSLGAWINSGTPYNGVLFSDKKK